MAIIGLKKLCPPAMLYLVLSLIAFFIMAIQNFGNLDIYCVGQYSCSVSNTWLIFVLKLLYIVFWTWILNILCSNGFTWLSWVLVLLPIVLFFILILGLFL